MRAQRKRVICCAVLGAALVAVLIKASWGYGSDDPMKGKSLAVATNAQDSGDPWKRVAGSDDGELSRVERGERGHCLGKRDGRDRDSDD